MTQRDTVRVLLRDYGDTFARQAGIRLADKPQPLWQLLTLALLASTRIRAEVAAAALREFSQAGLKSPTAMRDASWQERVDVLGRAHYKRYDESTATRLGQAAERILDDYNGDLRNLHGHGAGQVPSRLQEFNGIGPVGADIFCREVQGVWPDLAPYADSAALEGARRLGLPDEPDRLARLTDAPHLPSLLAACARAARDRSLVEAVLAAVG